MKVFRGRAGGPSEKRSATFSGTVYGDSIMPMIPEKVSMGSVCFEPGARTYWHAHGVGQILQVTSGSGYVCKDGEAPQAIRAGDVVWIGAGERHWHGASGESYMVHTATSIGGTDWQEEVAEEAYRAAVGAGGPKIL